MFGAEGVIALSTPKSDLAGGVKSAQSMLAMPAHSTYPWRVCESSYKCTHVKVDRKTRILKLYDHFVRDETVFTMSSQTQVEQRSQVADQNSVDNLQVAWLSGPGTNDCCTFLKSYSGSCPMTKPSVVLRQMKNITLHRVKAHHHN